MKELIKNIALFTLFSSLGYILFICIWGVTVPEMYSRNLNYKIGAYGHLNSRIKDVQNAKDIDVLFLGSSHVYRGLDPRIFEEHGIKAFNLGSSSQTPIQTELLLKRYLESLNPKMILYDIYPETFGNDGVESSLDIIANSENDFESFKMALKINHVKTYNTMIYGFFRDNFSLNANFNEPIIKDRDTYVKNGFVEKQLSYNERTTKLIMPWSFEEKQQKAFENVLKLIDDKGIARKLIQIPVTKIRYEGYERKDVFESYIKKQGEYYDFNLLLNLSDTLHFYDTQHLNSKGVSLFDNFLIEKVLKK